MESASLDKTTGSQLSAAKPDESLDQSLKRAKQEYRQLEADKKLHASTQTLGCRLSSTLVVPVRAWEAGQIVNPERIK